VGKPRYPREWAWEYWRQVRAGRSRDEAASAAGVSQGTASRWFREAGGVIPPDLDRPSGLRLSFAEREEMALLIAAGKTDAVIARALGRHRATIGRERARGVQRTKSGYKATVAQSLADERGRRPKPAKLVVNERLHTEVQARLERKDSPEQISQRLRMDFPDDPEMWVSHETIYQAIYVQGRGALKRELAACLRTGRAIRRTNRQSAKRTSRIPGMVNISERPKEVADRAVPGHWEGDLITGKENASAIGTLVERVTGYVMLLHLPERHGAVEVQDAMIEAMSRLPDWQRKTVTWDQGQEMSNHAKITLATDVKIYFCDPGSPWQRPVNENTNGLLRQYFPKGTDLSGYHRDYLEFVANQLNDRPRKRLHWRTPKEALRELISSSTDPPDVATTG
jgi:IS30 family transposase